MFYKNFRIRLLNLLRIEFLYIGEIYIQYQALVSILQTLLRSIDDRASLEVHVFCDLQDKRITLERFNFRTYSMSHFTALKVKMTCLLLYLIVFEHVDTDDMISKAVVVVYIFFHLAVNFILKFLRPIYFEFPRKMCCRLVQCKLIYYNMYTI